MRHTGTRTRRSITRATGTNHTTGTNRTRMLTLTAEEAEVRYEAIAFTQVH
jgi:hypothetical protein